MENQLLTKDGKVIANYQEKVSKAEKIDQILNKVSEVEWKERNELEFKAELKSLENLYQSKELRFDESWAF